LPLAVVLFLALVELVLLALWFGVGAGTIVYAAVVVFAAVTFVFAAVFPF